MKIINNIFINSFIAKHSAYVFTAVFGLFIVAGCVSQSDFQAGKTSQIPKTDNAFLNNPNNFQFVIVGDRTGGHRPGVFANAMQKINLLQPEFVVCVGDLIEGYTDDRKRINQQWDELDNLVAQLQMPFFYTAGNHDISNTTMRDIWQQRRGDTYYSFIYKDVLFISLDTEDPPIQLSEAAVQGQTKLEVMMQNDPDGTQQKLLEMSRTNNKQPAELPGDVAFSEAQLAFLKTTLDNHPDVRWTILLMHKPAWNYNNPAFDRIEAMLADRDYSMIAGHEHYYMYTARKERDYITMGTTGGVWLQDGPGRSDHIAWVTMTESGPVFANLKLNGITGKEGL